ncbi:urease accessory protein UreH domain-containing protein [Thiohalorhabdus denitrificans]|nr:sulfite exporter TauE/SafE family protein [Thiohalorhabdus denitrificans]
MEPAGILALGFGLGALHALDADHLLAVTGLSGSETRQSGGLRYCLPWALGHGMALFAVGGAVLALDLAIPHRLSAWAEILVGVLLAYIGARLVGNWWTERYPRGEGEAPRSRGAYLVGLIHGTAGTAPLLAVLPAAAMHSEWAGLAYLAIFCVGVLTAMLAFGGVLGSTIAALARRRDRSLGMARAGIGITAFTMGLVLVGETWAHG